MNRDESIDAGLQKKLWTRLDFEKLIANLSAEFVNIAPDKVDNIIIGGLKQIVEFFGVDRSTLFKFSTDRKEILSTHSYAIDGVPTRAHIHVHLEFPVTVRKWRRGEVFCLSSVEDLPEESDRESYRKWGIASTMTIPLSLGGSVEYVIAIGNANHERSWPEELIPRLQLIGEVFANALARKETAEKSEDLMHRLEMDNVSLTDDVKKYLKFDELDGRSEAMEYVYHRISRVAATTTPVLVLGETGTGKELVARAIHRRSLRKDRLLIKVNCSNLPATFIERELFGHEKGAFSGAHKRQQGRFEYADGGTLFLDEIGDLPLELQPKLLRVLQDGEFERLGNPRTIKVDVRVIAATNRDLTRAVEEGRFRRDLFYRLNVFPISVPPLRDRSADIPLLVKALSKKIGTRLGKKCNSIPRQSINALMKYNWPGNVRELENLIERAAILSDGPDLLIELPLSIQRGSPGNRTLEEVEREHIFRVLAKTGWRIKGKEREFRQELDCFESVRGFIDQFKASRGCIDVNVRNDSTQYFQFIIESQWDDLECLQEHFRSDSFTVFLGALNVLCSESDMRIADGIKISGIEAVHEARKLR